MKYFQMFSGPLGNPKYPYGHMISCSSLLKVLNYKHSFIGHYAATLCISQSISCVNLCDRSETSDMYRLEHTDELHSLSGGVIPAA